MKNMIIGLGLCSLLFACGGEKRVPGPPLNPSQLRWKIGECTKKRVDDAYRVMMAGNGAPWASMYFLRCSDPSDYRRELRKIKQRRKE